MPPAARKLFYKIGEVCEICGVEPHVLRYWESEFTLLSPTKNRAGQRTYRASDLQLIQTIKHMLYEEGYTISGANKKLLADGRDALPLFREKRQLPPDHSKALSRIRKEAEQILKLLED